MEKEMKEWVDIFMVENEKKSKKRFAFGIKTKKKENFEEDLKMEKTMTS